MLCGAGALTEIEPLVSWQGLSTAEGLAVDWLAENLYWVESRLHQIEVPLSFLIYIYIYILFTIYKTDLLIYLYSKVTTDFVLLSLIQIEATSVNKSCICLNYTKIYSRITLFSSLLLLLLCYNNQAVVVE